ncbi:semaphorin-4G [Engraulis encrasicolus]|uniref:semaphorin-4G n=1 Tax=Engraulis encrasicolus TaxID=184585 RepID=UPI002FD2D459
MERRTHHRLAPCLVFPVSVPVLALLGCLPCMLLGFPFGPAYPLDPTPRITVPIDGLLGCNRFSGGAVNYSTLLLEEEAGVLYAGARDAIYALDTNNISSTRSNYTIKWPATPEQKRQCLNKGRDNQTECYNHIRFLQRLNETHLYTCGTHAFKPLCAYLDVEQFHLSRFEDGRDRCPYDPVKSYTGMLLDGDMFSASQYEFRSNSDVRRNFPFPLLKTEEAPTRWLMEADFVGSALLRESVNSSIGDDDKIYFFFTEKDMEQSPYSSHTRVARVARVCRGDIGGQRTLQRRWTSFLKARLLCTLPDYQLQLNVLKSAALLETPNVTDSLFYGVFGLEWKGAKASAVCVYSHSDIQKAFDGPYMEMQDSKWREFTGKVPEPRPGSCITNQHRALLINSSRDLPDNVLSFVRRHPLMASPVLPLRGRPLLVKRSINYSKITLLPVAAASGAVYNMLFLCTDEGWLHRAVELEDHVHIVEELQLFRVPQQIYSMVISQSQRSVYLSSQSGVVQVPLSTCRRYTSCFDCVFARDPFCAWNGRTCVDISQYANRSTLIQDIEMGKRGCPSNTLDWSAMHRTRSVMAGDDVLLQCKLRSNLATPLWTLNGRDLATSSSSGSSSTSSSGWSAGSAVVPGWTSPSSSGYRVGPDGLLIVSARPRQSGSYRCFSVENGLRVPSRRYTVWIQAPVLPSPSSLRPDDDRHRDNEDDYDIADDDDDDDNQLLFLSTSAPTPLSALPAPLPPGGPEGSQAYRHMEALYVSLVAVLGGLCLVLTVVLLYVSFCARGGGGGGGGGAGNQIRKYSQQLAGAMSGERKRSSHFELKTVSSHCNGRSSRRGTALAEDGSFLQIMSPGGDGGCIPGSPCNSDRTPPPAPPLPVAPPLPGGGAEYANTNGLSATLPSVLRKMNGNSYVLLGQAEVAESTSPLYHSFTEELNRILEKRKHTQLDDDPAHEHEQHLQTDTESSL